MKRYYIYLGILIILVAFIGLSFYIRSASSANAFHKFIFGGFSSSSVSTITLVNQTGAQPIGPTGSFTLPAINVTAGNFIIGCGASTDGKTVTSVTDTAGNSYTIATTVSAAATPPSVSLFYAKNVTGNASDVITINLSGNPFQAYGVAAQYSGVDTTNPLDAVASGYNNSPFNTQQTNQFTTTSANEGIYSCIAIDNIRVQTATSPYTLEFGGGGDKTTGSELWSEDNIVSSIQTNIRTGFGGIDRFNIVAQTFKAATVVTSSGTPHKFIFNGNNKVILQ